MTRLTDREMLAGTKHLTRLGRARPVRVGACAACGLLLLAGCGGHDASPSTSTGGAEPIVPSVEPLEGTRPDPRGLRLTKRAFIRRADAICTAVNRELDEPAGDRDPVALALARGGAIETAAVRLAALRSPQPDQAFWDARLSELDAMVAEVRLGRRAAERNDIARAALSLQHLAVMASQSDLAMARYGFTACWRQVPARTRSQRSSGVTP